MERGVIGCGVKMMTIYDTFSKRNKTPEELNKPLIYDELPAGLREQIIYIFNELMNKIIISRDDILPLGRYIISSIRQELGLRILYPVSTEFFQGDKINWPDEFQAFFRSYKDTINLLDAIDVTFQSLDTYIKSKGGINNASGEIILENFIEASNKATEALNQRFREHRVGYQFIRNQIVRVDSQYLHAKTIAPVIKLLNDPIYENAEKEFLQALEHQRQCNYADSITWCCKSFESVMKIICDKRQWQYNQNDTAKTLIEICFENKLIPDYLQNKFNSLKNLLESSISTVRNKAGAHGKGTNNVIIPEYLASYTINMTATTLIFLIEAEKSLSRN